MPSLEQVTSVESLGYWPGEIPIRHVYTAGVAGERFLRELKGRRRFMATRCDRCDYTYLPPRAYCERCFQKLKRWLEVGPQQREARPLQGCRRKAGEQGPAAQLADPALELDRPILGDRLSERACVDTVVIDAGGAADQPDAALADVPEEAEPRAKLVDLIVVVCVRYSSSFPPILVEPNRIVVENLELVAQAQEHVESRPEAEIMVIGVGCSPHFQRWAHVGDKVLLGENTGEPWDEYFVVFEEEILALLFEEESQREARVANIKLVDKEDPLPPLVQFLRQ